MSPLRIELLCSEAEQFSILESQHQESSLYGVTDGKAVGTYLEQKFKSYLQEKYDFVAGSSASGDDTVYFLSFEEEEKARQFFDILTSPEIISFYLSLIFWDEKRPIKASIFNCLD